MEDLIELPLLWIALLKIALVSEWLTFAETRQSEGVQSDLLLTNFFLQIKLKDT